jgi:hypothetical protein
MTLRSPVQQFLPTEWRMRQIYHIQPAENAGLAEMACIQSRNETRDFLS